MSWQGIVMVTQRIWPLFYNREGIGNWLRHTIWVMPSVQIANGYPRFPIDSLGFPYDG